MSYDSKLVILLYLEEEVKKLLNFVSSALNQK
jgi:hypothetical protein